MRKSSFAANFKPDRCAAPPASSEVRAVTLPNGTRLLLKPERDAEVVAIIAFVRMEPDVTPAEAATGELVARALFFGSQNRSADRIARSISQVGGNLETLRTPDYVAITCVTVAEQLREAVYSLCEALKNADFAPEALERAREQRTAERRKRALNGFETAYAALCERIRGVAEPDEDTLRRVTQAQAQDYFQRRYQPARTVIAVVGGFEAEAARRAFDNDLFDYSRPPFRPRSVPKTPDKPDFSMQGLTFASSGHSAYALVGTPAPGVASPDYPAFSILHTLLGGGHAARLFRRVRDTLGFGYDVAATYQADRAEPLVAHLQWDTRRVSPPVNTAPAPQPSGGKWGKEERKTQLPNYPITQHPTPNTQRPTPNAQRLLNAQLDSLLTDPPSEEELTRACNVAIGRDALHHERARDRAFLLGWYEVMGLGYAFDADFPRRLVAVTRADLLRVAKTYLSRRVGVVSLPKSE